MGWSCLHEVMGFERGCWTFELVGDGLVKNLEFVGVGFGGEFCSYGSSLTKTLYHKVYSFALP